MSSPTQKISFSFTQSDLIDKSPLQKLENEKQILQNELSINSREFKDVLIYCKRTIQLQDDEINRLEEALDVSRRHLEERLIEAHRLSREEANNLNVELEKMRSENLLMVTQIGNQQQMELELAEMRKTIDDLRQAVALRDEKINKRELREREIALVTEQKVRDEVQKEFQSEIAKISKELKLQNAVQVEANNAIMKKLNSKIEEEQRNLAETRLKAKETIEDLARAQKTIAVHEHDKKRLEEHLQKAKQQTDKLLRESKKHLEDSEKLRLKDLARHNENANAMRAENLELKTSLRIVSDALTSAKIDLKKESALRMQTLAAHSDQNVKLQELRDFLKLVLEDNNDDYVDAILGENRLAVFFKLSMLLERIPVVK